MPIPLKHIKYYFVYFQKLFYSTLLATIGHSLEHSLVKFLHELPEDHGVHVLAKLVEDEPVPQAQSPADALHLALLHQPGPGLHDALPQPGDHHQHQPVHRLGGGQGFLFRSTLCPVVLTPLKVSYLGHKNMSYICEIQSYI